MAVMTGARIVAEEHFTLTFDGPAVELNRMGVAELAPALLGLAAAVKEAHRLVQPNEAEPRLEIVANREGSFMVDLMLSDGGGLLGNLLRAGRDALAGPDVTATINLAALTTIVWRAIDAVKWLFRRTLREQRTNDDGTVTLIDSAGNTLIIPAGSSRLITDHDFRAAVRELFTPLDSPGVDEVRLDHERHGRLAVERSEVRAFDVPAAVDEQITDSVREVAVYPLNVAFVEGNKWRLSDGEQSFFATVADREFLDRVATNQESFARSDILRVQLRTRQYRTDEGLRSDHVIERVLTHIAGPRQVPLPFDTDD